MSPTAKWLHRVRRLALVLALGGAAEANAGTERLAAILTRAFSYDYNLKSRAGDSLVLAVVYKAGDSASEGVADSWVKGFGTLAGVKTQGMVLTVVKVAYENPAGLKASIASQGIDILLICDRLDGEVNAIKELSRAMKLLTVGVKESYVSGGLSLGVFPDGEQNTIEVNLPAATAENVSFSSDLLRLAKVLR